MEHVPPRLRDPRAQPLLVAAQSRAVGGPLSRSRFCFRHAAQSSCTMHASTASPWRGGRPHQRSRRKRSLSSSPYPQYTLEKPFTARYSAERRTRTPPANESGCARAARRPGRNSTRGSTRRSSARLGREAVEVVHRDVVEARPVVPARAARIGERLEGGVHERAAVEREGVDLVGGEDVVAHAEPSEDRRQPCAKLGHGSRRAQRHDDRERRRLVVGGGAGGGARGRGAARRWQPPSLWASYHEQPVDSQRNAEAAPATPSAWAAAAMVSPPRVAPLPWYSIPHGTHARPFRRRTLGE